VAAAAAILPEGFPQVGIPLSTGHQFSPLAIGFFGTGHPWIAYFILPIISSMDNFMVGAALGIGGQEMSLLTVLIVACANAAGMLLAGFVGTMVAAWAPMAASLLAGIAFVAIGGMELQAWWSKEESPTDKLVTLAVTQNPWVLALPMSFNNLATGLAGGLLGGSIWVTAFMTFVASFCLMYLGYFIGKFAAKAVPTDPRLAIGIVFVLCGLIQLVPVAVGQSFV